MDYPQITGLLITQLYTALFLSIQADQLLTEHRLISGIEGASGVTQNRKLLRGSVPGTDITVNGEEFHCELTSPV